MEIIIKEYQPEYAAAVADMWNASGEAWNGSRFASTEQSVLREEATSPALRLWLAFAGEEVVGYCKLSVYREDEGALYIDLLNVRPDWHGRRIGKTLVLQAVRETIARGWPRLDLYTWPGNTKAVPLYKKCGFFWEKDSNRTHLMNFIPTALNTDLINEFFQDADWYADSTRELTQSPDGVADGEQEYYTYRWKKETRVLEVDFCRYSRKIRRIETDEFEIEQRVAVAKPLMGRSYPVEFRFRNKTAHPLTFRLIGRNNKNIRCDFEREITVVDQECVTQEFFVESAKTLPANMGTQPAVLTEVILNDRQAVFGQGVRPAYPLQTWLKFPERVGRPERSTQVWLECNNQSSRKAIYRFTLPEHPDISFDRKEFEIELEPNGKTSLALQATIHRACVYVQEISVLSLESDGSEYSFIRDLSGVFPTIDGIAWGRIGPTYYALAGAYKLKLSGSSPYNKLSVCNLGKSQDDVVPFMLQPHRLGPPYTAEFTSREAENVAFSRQDGALVIRADYTSEYYPGLKFQLYHRLSVTGLLERWVDAENSGDKELPEIWLQSSATLFPQYLIAPLDGRITKLDNHLSGGLDNLKAGRLHENWVFRQGDDDPVGFSWPAGCFPQIHSTLLTVEQSLRHLSPGTISHGDPLLFSLGAFREWTAWREYITGEIRTNGSMTTSAPLLSINHGNPLTDGALHLEFHDTQDVPSELAISALPVGDNHDPIFLEKAETGLWRAEIAANSDNPLQRVKFLYQTEFMKKSENRLAFLRSGCVKQTTIEQDGLFSKRVNNGIISISAAADFAPALYSLRYKGREWLHNTFPRIGPLSWTNYFIGGIHQMLGTMSNQSLSDEPFDIGFIQRADQYGNIWAGLRITLTVTVSKYGRGIGLNLDCLMAPGVPVLALASTIHQESGNYQDLVLITEAYFISDSLKNTYAHVKDRSGLPFTVNGGDEQIYILPREQYWFTGQDRPERLYIVRSLEDTKAEVEPGDKIFFHNTEERLHTPAGHHIALPVKLLLFSEEDLTWPELAPLLELSFID